MPPKKQPFVLSSLSAAEKMSAAKGSVHEFTVKDIYKKDVSMSAWCAAPRAGEAETGNGDERRATHTSPHPSER